MSEIKRPVGSDALDALSALRAERDALAVENASLREALERLASEIEDRDGVIGWSPDAARCMRDALAAAKNLLATPPSEAVRRVMAEARYGRAQYAFIVVAHRIDERGGILGEDDNPQLRALADEVKAAKAALRTLDGTVTVTLDPSDEALEVCRWLIDHTSAECPDQVYYTFIPSSVWMMARSAVEAADKSDANVG